MIKLYYNKKVKNSLLFSLYKLKCIWSSDNMTFGEKLKLLRYEKGLTQDDIGYLLNVTKSCISCYEKGTRQPSLDVLIQLASYFRVSVDFLIGIESYDSNTKVRLTRKDIELINALKNNPAIYKEIVKNVNDSVLKIKKIFE